MGTHRVQDPGIRAAALVLTFMTGALIGAGVALLLAPEPGTDMRRRLRRGAKTAQDELTDVAAETREALEALTKDARQTIRQTASRLTDVIEATREAIITEMPSLKGLNRNG